MHRIGFGNDIHRLEAGRPLIIGGVPIDSDLGAMGHSDADVLLHAVTDALLGALALGDIGTHFSDRDLRWKDADSMVFLREAARQMKELGYRVGNVDSTVELEAPKLRPYIDEMRANLAKALETDLENISAKAKTAEGLGEIGTRQALKATAVVLLVKT
jgi:2-C-methyl-D-erythritol 2,4-cyclodiphosphate synthase